LNYLQRRNGVILRYFSEFGYLPGVLRKSSRSLSHLLMSSCNVCVLCLSAQWCKPCVIALHQIELPASFLLCSALFRHKAVPFLLVIHLSLLGDVYVAKRHQAMLFTTRVYLLARLARSCLSSLALPACHES